MNRFLAAVLVAGVSMTATASEMPVPVDVQLPIFAKIRKMDRAFSATVVTMAIVYQESHAPSVLVKSQVVSWVERHDPGIRILAVALDREAGLTALRGITADVFYIAPLRGADIAAIAQLARERKIRTITGVPEYVSSGISVSIDVRNDRPLIVINIPGSKAEGSSFPAQLLQLARVVR
jgi:hypothetical protein